MPNHDPDNAPAPGTNSKAALNDWFASRKPEVLQSYAGLSRIKPGQKTAPECELPPKTAEEETAFYRAKMAALRPGLDWFTMVRKRIEQEAPDFRHDLLSNNDIMDRMFGPDFPIQLTKTDKDNYIIAMCSVHGAWRLLDETG
jgi:hypothetical protein